MTGLLLGKTRQAAIADDVCCDLLCDMTEALADAAFTGRSPFPGSSPRPVGTPPRRAVPDPDNVPWPIRLRQALKRLLRRDHLRCVQAQLAGGRSSPTQADAAELIWLQALVEDLAARCAGQAELLARRAESPGSLCLRAVPRRTSGVPSPEFWRDLPRK
jgi:hypothetical protein